MKFFRQWFVSLVLFLIFLASSWQLLITPGMYRVHDPTHVSRITEMTRSLQAGHFPVRWTPNFGWGYGMPLFEFYAPLPFYVGSFFYWLGFNPIFSLKLLYLIANLLSLFGMYLLGRKLFGSLGGLVAAASFTLAPYRAVNLFVRGALSEAWGIMAMPLILYSLAQIIDTLATSQQKQQRTERIKWSMINGQWSMLVVSLCILVLSHNLSAFMFIPASLVFALAYAFKQGLFTLKFKQLIKSFWFLISGFILSLGLISFYVFPAFLEKGNTIVENQILTGYFHYTNHFLYIRQFFWENWGYGGSVGGLMDEMSFFWGFGQLITLGLLGLVLLKQLVNLLKTKDQRLKIKDQLLSFISQHFILWSFFLILFSSCFMTLYKARPIWDTLLILSFIQFPWRWLTIAILFLALINGYLITQLKSKLRRAVAASVLVAILLINGKYFQFKEVKDDPWEYHCEEADCIIEEMSDILPDYYPANVADHGQLQDARELLKETEQLKILVNLGHQKLMRTEFANETEIRLPIAHYPGWRAELDGESADQILKIDEQGIYYLVVPAGKHQVGVYFGSTPVRFWSDLVSAISLLVFLYLIINLKSLSGNGEKA